MQGSRLRISLNRAEVSFQEGLNGTGHGATWYRFYQIFVLRSRVMEHLTSKMPSMALQLNFCSGYLEGIVRDPFRTGPARRAGTRSTQGWENGLGWTVTDWKPELETFYDRGA